MKALKSLLPAIFVLAALGGNLKAQDAVLISEFLAANTGPVVDEDGDTSDWIELFNAGTNAVNLAGWHLTDEATDLNKWTFPATNLPPGGYLVVFASGKDRAVAGAPLHTSFQLSAAGEYLALVRPDGQTVAHQFAPAYPAQVDGLSYGVEVAVTVSPFVVAGANARWRVPTGPEDFPADWATTNFSDAAWALGPTGLGFDAGGSGFAGTSTNVARGKVATQSSTLGGFTAELAVDGNPGNFTHTAAGQNLPATWEVNLGTNYGLERIVLHNRGDGCCGSRLRDIRVLVLDVTGTATNYTSPLLNPENVLGGGSLNGPASLSLNLTQLTGGLVLGGRVRVVRTPDPDRSGSGGQGNADEPDVLSLGEVEVFGVPAAPSFGDLIRTDLAAAMQGFNASALVRIPFTIPTEELPELDALLLRLAYDDGVVAYLNGVEIARRHAPALLAWNAAAVGERPDSAARSVETVDVTAHRGLLIEGENVLALHGLNRTAADDDFLLLPELVGETRRVAAERYFAQPTPGGLNTGGALGRVADTRFSVDRGFFDAPFSLVITTATAGAEIRFTTNGAAPGPTSGHLYTAPIPISRTTVVRAQAFKPGWQPSDVDTHTYIFLSDVIAQSHQTVTNAGFPNTWSGVAADYAMDPRITGPYATGMVASLRSLPSVFFSTSVSNLFDAATGFYSHPTSHGVAWERPVSFEFVNPDGSTGFQVDCGLRIQGGYFRDPNVTQKHSLRVLFKDEYGPGRLRYPLFAEEDAVEEFDTLVLRAGANDGYAWNEARDTEQFIRDEFGRSLHRDMGHPAPHGRFVHLYFNGVYWGLYNIVERPNEDFSASYFGGRPEDWDANNAGDVKSGDLTAWNSLTALTPQVNSPAAYERIQGNHPDGTRNPAYPVLFDKINYIDYMIANIWGGNWDWPNKNFWFGRLRTAESTGFKFYMWDFENTMGNNRARSPVNMVAPRADIASSWVGQPHFYLKNHQEYRMDFADRVQRYFFDDGILTVPALTNRYRALADVVEQAIIAESARWGDDNLNPPQDQTDWLREREWILGTYLPQRSEVVLQQFRAAGLYPPIGAPSFSHRGGFVDTNFSLTISQTNAGGVIYYTLDGTDPRRRGGAVSAGALPYGGPIAIEGNAHVRARVAIGTNWSALVEATFTTAEYFRDLVVTEIHYNPPPAGAVSGDEFEFVELKNTGRRTLNLSGLAFTGGVAFSFTNGTRLAPGAFFLLVRNRTQFAARYPGVTAHGVFSGRLDNGGETLELA
ncbi:MAG TPA: lamin tail domain-containing protein, partial [Methylomirabilota bacterium]|nr:lamin tail domain-containing protein [Methylomirabilota bacterium]